MQPRVSLKGSKPLINFPATYQGAEPRLVLQQLLQQTRDLSGVPRLAQREKRSLCSFGW